jgi:hypothetical protein
MLLRRIKNNIKTENWFAVLIDFLIVVLAVFVGLQIWNWNEEHSAQSYYLPALERLDTEIKINNLTVAKVDTEAVQSLQIFWDALDILFSCSDSESNRLLVNKGINELRNTNGIFLRHQALQELTSSPRLLSHQTAQVRQRFTDMLIHFEMAKVNSDLAEDNPLKKRFEDNPLLSVGPRLTLTNKDYADDIPHIRSIELNTPIDVACKNDPLIKAFVTWERWQGDLLPMVWQIRKELNASAAVLPLIFA